MVKGWQSAEEQSSTTENVAVKSASSVKEKHLVETENRAFKVVDTRNADITKYVILHEGMDSLRRR